MNEEKKLDEKTLEAVSGGGSDEGYINFLLRNCISCVRPDCPYGHNSVAFDKLGDAVCPEKEAKRYD